MCSLDAKHMRKVLLFGQRIGIGLALAVSMATGWANGYRLPDQDAQATARGEADREATLRVAVVGRSSFRLAAGTFDSPVLRSLSRVLLLQFDHVFQEAL